MGAGGGKDGQESHSRQCEDGTGKIFERKIMFVRFVHTVRFFGDNI